MGMFGKRQNGATMGGYAGGTFDMDGRPVDPLPAPMNIPMPDGSTPMAPPVSAPSDKMPLWKAALGGLFDSIAQQTGGKATFLPALLARQQEERENQNAFARWQRQYDYQLKNPKPVSNDTAADYDFWKAHMTPEQFSAWVQNKADPPQYRQGPDGQFYRIQTAAPPPITEEDFAKGQVVGGGASNGAGGFHIPSGNPLIPPRR